jgi:signal transduction histidine kinase
LSKSELDGIFEPYTQLDKTRKKTITRALSLGTAHTLIKRMGGYFNVESQVMKGSLFTIILPNENIHKGEE